MKSSSWSASSRAAVMRCKKAGEAVLPGFFVALTGVFGALAQHEFLDLAGRGLRQGAEDDMPRRLEAGHVLAAEGDDGGFEHGRVTVQDVLDLDRRDVLAARDDDVL